MRPSLRALLLPRRFARLRFTFYEAAGLLGIAGMSLAIGLSFLHDGLAISLGIIGASLFNGLLCYLVGIGIGRCGGKRLEPGSRSVPRFTIRDMLWLTALVAAIVAWCVASNNWQRERVRHQQSQAELSAELATIRPNLYRREQDDGYRQQRLKQLESERNPSWPLTAEQVARIDDQLAKHELTFNPEADRFEHAYAAPLVKIDWEDLAFYYLPDLSLHDIIAYQQHKREQLERTQAEQRSP